MNTKQLLAEIERFNEKNSAFDVGFHILIEGIKLAHGGIALLSTPASASDVAGSYFQQAKSFFREAKQILAETPGFSAELKALLERYNRFCDRILSELRD
jgi:hypothetical protein